MKVLYVSKYLSDVPQGQGRMAWGLVISEPCNFDTVKDSPNKRNHQGEVRKQKH